MATKKVWLGVGDSVGLGETSPISISIQSLLLDQVMTFRKSVEVPLGYTTISAITLRYRRTGTGNLYLKFASSHIASASDSTPTEDADSYTVYAAGTADNKIANITVPASAYNALTGMSAGDVFNIAVWRDDSGATDTYTTDFDVAGFLVEFTVASVSGGAIAAATNAIITLDEVKDYLKISLTSSEEDDFLQSAINNASNEIEDYIDNKVVVQTITDEIYDGDGRKRLYTNYYPIVGLGIAGADSAAQLAALRVRDDVDDTFAAVEININHIHLDIRKPCVELFDEVFPYGRQTIKITYRAGWSTVPTDFKDACLMLAVAKYKDSMRGDNRFGIESNSSGGMAVGGSARYIDARKKAYELISAYRKFC
jgi:hypothetical protein